ncbi:MULTISPECIES: MBL fold metallo-hydrolase [Candidatus Nitrosocaldus]|jgi:glyoxylase-like metal-dependent hydrolase (beta-lactamase superfamily II)|uniref:Beta-lactamase domain-containing protein (GloB) n=1 Tax=Candidatus Nitrosocaldus cavascurensis TaxID=2058097 RepID=A0A2K5APE9_9ARCH|nr:MULTISPECIES: MBL fold metallo-hydrolase [Candidatus Nitrosocaldus]SPC33514.1 Beta-lactamase domain-containing protein (GloB) [Candidatus Nitrosocaldus cavascurensis]
MIVRQIKVGRMANFTYIVGDESSKVAAVIDPSWDLEVVMDEIKRNSMRLEYIINTHTHFDHVLGNEQLKALTGAKIVMHANSPLDKDVAVDDNDVIALGNLRIKVIYTPGHSKDSICLLVENKLFTGDTLFVGSCGRVDLPGGDAGELYESLRRIASLDESIEVYPGHDYGYERYSTIGKEKRSNPVLRVKSKDEFIMLVGG